MVQAIRVYKSSPNGWTLQVRGPEGIGPGGIQKGKAFMIAGASCTIEDLRALRDAINEELAHEEPIAAWSDGGIVADLAFNNRPEVQEGIRFNGTFPVVAKVKP